MLFCRKSAFFGVKIRIIQEIYVFSTKKWSFTILVFNFKVEIFSFLLKTYKVHFKNVYMVWTKYYGLVDDATIFFIKKTKYFWLFNSKKLKTKKSCHFFIESTYFRPIQRVFVKYCEVYHLRRIVVKRDKKVTSK